MVTDGYLVEALRPLYRDLVPLRWRNQAERRFLCRRTVPLSIVIHLSAQLTAALGVLAGHVVDVIGGAGFDVARGQLARFHRLDDAAAIPGGEYHGLSAAAG